MNRITLIGNTGHSAVSRKTENGGMVTFSLAVSERRKNDQGQWENARTDWFDCVVYTRTAEGASQLGASITHGTRLGVTGKMYSRQYEKDGIRRTAWSVRVDEVEFVGDRKEAAPGEAAPEAESGPAPVVQAPEASPEPEAKQDDLPF